MTGLQKLKWNSTKEASWIKEIDTSRNFTLHNFSSWLLKFDVWNYEYDYYLKAMKHKMVSAAILYYLVLLMTVNKAWM